MSREVALSLQSLPTLSLSLCSCPRRCLENAHNHLVVCEQKPLLFWRPHSDKLSLSDSPRSLNAFVVWKCKCFPYLIQDPSPVKTPHCAELEHKRGLQSSLHSDQIEHCWPFGYFARIFGAIWTDYYRGRLLAVNLRKKANWRSEMEQWASYWWHHLPNEHYILHYMSASTHITSMYQPSVCVTLYILGKTS